MMKKKYNLVISVVTLAVLLFAFLLSNRKPPENEDAEPAVLMVETDIITETETESKTEKEIEVEMEMEELSTTAEQTTVLAETSKTSEATEPITSPSTEKMTTEAKTEAETQITIPELKIDAVAAAKFDYFYEDKTDRYNSYKTAHPEYTDQQVITYVDIGLDNPFYSAPIVNTNPDPDNYLILCNKYNQLPADYIPPGYNVSDTKVNVLRDDAGVNFDAMQKAAANDGRTLTIISGYRSYSYQSGLYNTYKARDGQANADRYSARAGFSEHQTGLAADLNTITNFDSTNEFAWLKDNAYKYGFILRYPSGKEFITGYMYEPWHWRYVGKEVAAIMKNENIETFEEYLVKYENYRN